MVIDLNIDKQYDKYPQDTINIIEACKFFGIELTKDEAIYFWSCYSNMLAAGWIILPESKLEIYNIIKYVILEEINKNMHYLN